MHVSQTKIVRPLATRMTRNATMANKHHKSSNNSNMMVTKHLAGKRSVDKIHSQVMDRSQVAINQEFETHTQNSRMRVMNNN